MSAGEKIARGRAGFRLRWVTYAGFGGYAGAIVVGTASNANGPGVAAGALIGGGLLFWLGRRSSMESASAEAYSWAVATASSQATASALAGVQVNLNMDRGLLELSDPSGLHKRTVTLDQPAPTWLAEREAMQRLGQGPSLYETAPGVVQRILETAYEQNTSGKVEVANSGGARRGREDGPIEHDPVGEAFATTRREAGARADRHGHDSPASSLDAGRTPPRQSAATVENVTSSWPFGPRQDVT